MTINCKFPFSRFIINDRSMEPFLRQGDSVLTFNWVKVSVGDVVVFKNNNIYLVKRIDKVDREKIFVSGDNKEASSKIGPIDHQRVVGKVIFKY